MGIFVDALFERRASEADLISNPTAFFAALFGDEYVTDAGINVTPEAALKYSPVLSCVRVLAEGVAQVPWNVMRDTDQGPEVADDVVEHRLLHRSPNSRMTSFSFRVALMANACMHGAGFAELVWNGAYKLDSIRFIPSGKVKVLENPSTEELVYEVEDRDGKKRRVNSDSMIHVPTLALDGVTGHSLIKLHAQGIGLGLAAEKFGASFFGKGSRPSGILTSDMTLTDEQSTTLKNSWNESYGGSQNAGKTPVLSGGLKWQQISTSPDDAQFEQTRAFQVAEAARIFRIPGILLGIKETATYASAEQLMLSFVKFTLAPWAEAIEQEFDRKLFPKDMKMYTHLDMRGLMRGDAASRIAYYKGLFDVGAITSASIAKEEDLPVPPNGDRAYVQQNLMPVDMVDEVLKSKAAKPAQPQQDPNMDPNMDPQTNSIHKNWLESVVVRMRNWRNFEKPKAIDALKPVFQSWAGERKLDVDALCRALADEKLDEGFAQRAAARFEEACNV